MDHPVDVEAASFSEHTTLRVGGVVDSWIIARTEEACIEAVVECDDLDREVLILGGGSNVVCADAPFTGTVVQVACPGEALVEREGYVRAQVGAGEDWDAFVLRCVESGSSYLAPLSGIPGLVGATPIQNVGAYGAEVGDCIAAVRVWDRRERTVRSLSATECEFAYRTSVFKTDPSRFVVLGVEFILPLDESVVVSYRQLAHELGVREGDAVGGMEVREAVLDLRRAKGMVLDDEDHDTWSVGSFFVNPIIDHARARDIPDDCPTYPAEDGVKVSAAWLIESCGVGKGFALPGSHARVSRKHTLALTNTGGASCDEVLALAREIRARVLTSYGFELHVEPHLVGASL